MTSLSKLIPLLAVALPLTGASTAAASDEGEKIYQETCTVCHNAKSHPLDTVRLSREKWKEAVERMEGMGTDIPSGKKLSDLLDYHVRTYGPEKAAPAESK